MNATKQVAAFISLLLANDDSHFSTKCTYARQVHFVWVNKVYLQLLAFAVLAILLLLRKRGHLRRTEVRKMDVGLHCLLLSQQRKKNSSNESLTSPVGTRLCHLLQTYAEEECLALHALVRGISATAPELRDCAQRQTAISIF